MQSAFILAKNEIRMVKGNYSTTFPWMKTSTTTKMLETYELNYANFEPMEL